MSLRDPKRKMSKSDPDQNARLNLDDPPHAIAHKIRKAVTDSLTATHGISYDPAQRPGVSNLVAVLAGVQRRGVEEVAAECAGLGMGAFKERVAEAVVEHLRPMQARMAELEGDPGYVEKVLEEGAAAARMVAKQKFDEIWDVVARPPNVSKQMKIK
jgi:tryptophanyl-tRNA synthetase